MIVGMKKVTLLCTAADRDASLEALRDLGVLHVVAVQPPQSDALTQARQQADVATSVLAALRVAGWDDDDSSSSRDSSAERGRAVAEDGQATVQKIKAARERISALVAEEETVRPFGDADPEVVRALGEAGLFLRFYRVRAKDKVEIPDGVTAFEIAERGSYRWLALVGQESFSLPEETEVPLPERRQRDVLAEKEQQVAEIAQLEDHLHELAADHAALEAWQGELAERITYFETRDGMGAGGVVAYLEGFCPTTKLQRLEETARQQGWGLVVASPSATDTIPTLIKNPGWVRPIESLFQLLKILPGYREADVSVSFFGFMTIFFAMIIGDAGYGAVILAATILARLLSRNAPAEPFRLLYTFSISTMIWGVLNGTYFALPMGSLPPALQDLSVDYLKDTNNFMGLCLLIGAIHISIAHIWNIFRFINTLQAITQAGWLAVTWMIYFVARTMIVNAPFPGWYTPIGIVGLIAVVLFMTPVRKLKEEWVNHVMLPVTLMSNFGDVLSYLRLFALAVASVQLGGAFNAMASFDTPGHIVTGVLVLVLGHGLNILLCAISVLVHGVRLNALEFSMHFGLEWAGSEYRPFARSQAAPETSPAR